MFIEVRENNLISWAKYPFKENLLEINTDYNHVFDNNYEIVDGIVIYKTPEEPPLEETLPDTPSLS